MLRVRWQHHDVPVKAKLLAVVLSDVRVVPVDARVREPKLVGELTPDGDRALGLVGAIESIVEAEPVPVHGRLEVAVVADTHDQLASLSHP
jgi:hypothetical protein